MDSATLAAAVTSTTRECKWRKPDTLVNISGRLCMKIYVSQTVCATLLVLGCASHAFAQTAEITGRVTDASGAVVPGATINVVNVANGQNRHAAAHQDGNFTVPLLLPREYKVTVEQKGFKQITRTGVLLAVDQRAELNFSLQIGAVSEQIEVSAALAQLNTVEGSQGQVIENRRIVELPLNGRNYDELALLSAGAVQPLDTARFGGFSAGGLRDTQNNYLL